MIDLHCHILPGIDDGPETMEKSLAMLRLAATNGITHSVVTPHIQPGRYDNQRTNITKKFNELKIAAKKANIKIRLGMAAEVRIDTMVMGMLENDQIPFLGQIDGKDIVLIEMPHSHIPAGADKFFQWLYDRNIRPMIAHPERNKEVMRNFDRLKPFLDMDVLIQVTASSIAGGFGEEACKVATKLLEIGAVDILASDAHNTYHRPPELFPGMEAAAEVIGMEKAVELVLDNPMQLASVQFSSHKVDYVF